MNEAIKLAIEKGGYDSWKNEPETMWSYTKIKLDPLFWQALGRALGWIQDATAPKEIEDKLPDALKGGQLVLMAGLSDMPRWQYEWHRFIDWIAEGKSADEFFKQLITPNKGEEK